MTKAINRTKPICAAALSLALAIGCALTSYAADNYINLYGFVFTVNSSSEAVICDYDDRESDVVIPRSLLGRPVVQIADYAFCDDSVITAISFENADSLKRIGDNAFCGCGGLTSVKLPDDVELGFGAFQRCERIRSAELGNTITVIPEQCFFRCTSLVKAYLPDTVTEIEARAFEGCDNLVIYTPSYGYAYQYAMENNISVVPTDLECVLGDANGDGKININDVTEIQRHVAKLLKLKGVCIKAAEVNGDGKLDISDATVLQMYIAQYKLPFPIGEVIK